MPPFDQFGEKVIVIPRIKGKNRHFEPRFVMVLSGQRVTCINRDTSSHAVISGKAGGGVVSNNILNTGVIPAGESSTVTIQSCNRE